MNPTLDSHAPTLAQARDLLQHEQYDDARALLKELVRSDPQCTEAIRLLISIDKKQMQRRLEQIDEEHSHRLIKGRTRQSLKEIHAVLVGGVFLCAGIVYLYHFFQVGLNGEFPMTGKSGMVHMVSGKEALLYGLAFGIPGALAFIVGLSRMRLK